MLNHTKKSVLQGWKGASLMTLVALAGVAGPTMAAPASAAGTDASECQSYESDGWTVTRCPESPADQLISKTFSLSSLQSQGGIEKDCLDQEGVTFRLKYGDESPGRLVPRGVEISETGGVGVTGLIKFDTDSFAKGVRSLTMTNWTTEQRDVRVVLHCTSDPTRWYH